MLDYSMFKCKLMEPRTGTGYTFSEQSEFHDTRKYTKNNNKPRQGEQGSLRKQTNSNGVIRHVTYSTSTKICLNQKKIKDSAPQTK